MYPKHFIILLLQLLLATTVTRTDDGDNWLQDALKEMIGTKIPKDNILSQLCDFSLDKKGAPEGEEFVDYRILFPETNSATHKRLRFPKLNKVARIGPAEAAKRARRFGVAFPAKLLNNSDLLVLYDADSAMMAREAHWERNVYCMEWLAHTVQKHVERMMADTFYGGKAIDFKPMKIAVRTAIKNKTAELNKIKRDIRNFLASIKQMNMSDSESEEVKQLRGKLGDKIDEVAEEEGREGAEKASSMDLIVEFKHKSLSQKENEQKTNNNSVQVVISSAAKKWDLSFHPAGVNGTGTSAEGNANGQLKNRQHQRNETE